MWGRDPPRPPIGVRGDRLNSMSELRAPRVHAETEVRQVNRLGREPGRIAARQNPQCALRFRGKHEQMPGAFLDPVEDRLGGRFRQNHRDIGAAKTV